MRCNVCNNEVKEGALFCTNCGAKIQNNVQQSDIEIIESNQTSAPNQGNQKKEKKYKKDKSQNHGGNNNNNSAGNPQKKKGKKKPQQNKNNNNI